MDIQQLTFQYKGKKVLDNVTISIPKGQIVGLIGENGSGKSTLLRLMAGILTPTSGTIMFNGEKVTRRKTSNIAYIPDIDLFYEKQTAEEVFSFYESQFDDFSLEKAKEVAAFLQVPTNVKLGRMSKGNRGRIKLSAFLGRNADFYMMDEPFAGLDPIARESLMKAIIRFIDTETCSLILSTHEVNEVEPILDQVVLLQDGRLFAMDHVESIRHEYGEDTVNWMKNLNGKKVRK